MQLGKLHIVLVHLPIAMVLAAGAADLLWAITRRKFFSEAGLYCLLVALVTAPVTVLAGDWLMDLNYRGQEPLLAQQHSTAGFVALGLIVAASAARILWRIRGWKWCKALYILLIVAAVATIVVTGHLGGLLGHGETYFRGLLGGGG